MSCFDDHHLAFPIIFFFVPPSTKLSPYSFLDAANLVQIPTLHVPAVAPTRAPTSHRQVTATCVSHAAHFARQSLMCFSFCPGCMFDLGVTGALFLHLQPVKTMCYRTRARRNRPSRKLCRFFCLLCLVSHGSRISRSSHSTSVWGIKPVLISRSRACSLLRARPATKWLIIIRGAVSNDSGPC